MKFELQIQSINIENNQTTITAINPQVKVPMFTRPKILTMQVPTVVCGAMYGRVEVEVDPKSLDILLSVDGVAYGKVKIM